ncbi:hypothetical protein PXH66_06845 [Synoicihabitans lomoniglobus]|uniref:PIN domain-containing protein n=1 Tax=Synoicihabitans lomoniglobus TaxID=2909285 RepID=A0AAF0CR80_9BACT|nr:hypothetical protein PXH66_06845 [Opitutaceae bacterium LMO-M01]
MNPRYLDTGLDLKLIITAPLVFTVTAYAALQRAPIWFTRIVALEIENTLQAMRFRRSLSPSQLTAAQALVGHLCDEGKFVMAELSLDAIAAEMHHLTSTVTAWMGCRTLDPMHIAGAILLQNPKFFSTDKRQLTSAKLAGLTTVNLSSSNACTVAVPSTTEKMWPGDGAKAMGEVIPSDRLNRSALSAKAPYPSDLRRPFQWAQTQVARTGFWPVEKVNFRFRRMWCMAWLSPRKSA